MEREGSSRQKRVRSIRANTSNNGRSSRSSSIGVSTNNQILSGSPLVSSLLDRPHSGDQQSVKKDTNDSPIYYMGKHQYSQPSATMIIYMLIQINCNFSHVFNKCMFTHKFMCFSLKQSKVHKRVVIPHRGMKVENREYMLKK